MQVGRYEVLEIIGTGANGSVVRAHDPMIGRLVAIKLLPPELAKGEQGIGFCKKHGWWGNYRIRPSLRCMTWALKSPRRRRTW